jgi:hypothetical protein
MGKEGKELNYGHKTAIPYQSQIQSSILTLAKNKKR